MTTKPATALSIATALFLGAIGAIGAIGASGARAATVSLAGGPTVVVPSADLKWKDMGSGIAAAPVAGDMEKGASKFFLRYPVGLVTPKHHHDADHSVAVVSGAITLTVDGKDYRLGTGSYFALTGKAVHVAKVEGKEPAVFFIQADGPWNLVMNE